MTVYIVSGCDGDCDWVSGVYATEKLAEEATSILNNEGEYSYYYAEFEVLYKIAEKINS